MYMIWQVIATNGQQKPVVDTATILVLYVEAVTAPTLTTREVVPTMIRPATPTVRPTATPTSFHSAQFYTYRTEC